jgi:isopenicillin-N epimerase
MQLTAPMDDFGRRARSLWDMDPDVAYLNHGAFGACPRPVLEEQTRLRSQLQAQPADFFLRRCWYQLDEARTAVASFLGADPQGLVFLPNATTGVAVVLHSLDLGPGDHVVTTDHVYDAVHNALRARGVVLTVVPFDLDDPDPAATVLAAVDERTRLVVVDAITSPTAWVLPVEDVVAGCRDRGVLCLVDAAHAPGQLPVDLAALDADFWVGNLHKWAYSPTGSAVLVAREDLRQRVRPLVVSHLEGYPLAFDWPGTVDPTAHLAAPTALELMGQLGWEAVREHGARVACAGAELLRDRLGAVLPFDDARSRHAQMVLVDLGLASLADAEALRERLRLTGIEVGATGWRGRGYLRLSGAPYNVPDDYERLADALSREPA